MKEKKMLYYPSDSGTNAYVDNIKKIISDFGTVTPFFFRYEVKYFFSLKKRYDYVFLNWLENEFLDCNGIVRVRYVVKVFLKLLFFKFRAKNIVFVRHNVYPHNTCENHRGLVKKLISILEYCAEKTIIHSPVAVGASRFYIPLPLYSKDYVFGVSDAVDSDFFVIFGRISKYKKIEDIIKVFPLNKKLIIMGSSKEPEYVEFLKGISSNNITVMEGFISDEDAKKIITESQGLIISHCDEDMIVSASFFYSLSIGVRVLCVESDFLKWVGSVFEKDVICVHEDLLSLANSISSIGKRCGFSDYSLQLIESNFSDEVISDKIKAMMNNC